MPTDKEKKEMKKTELLQLTSGFSKKYLDEEYDTVIKELINKMARKRQVPFLTGRIEIWAAGVIHAVGTINFLFDNSFKPYVSVSDICDYFGTKQSTTTQKSKTIRDMFKIDYFDDTFSTETMKKQNPFQQFTMADGFIVPAEESDLEEDISEWEIPVARILGMPDKEIREKSKNNQLSSSLVVTEKRLRKYYQHLDYMLRFSFSATYEIEAGPGHEEEYQLKCYRLNKEIGTDSVYGVLIDARVGSTEVTVPLAELLIEEENQNAPYIALYQLWFWNYRL